MQTGALGALGVQIVAFLFLSEEKKISPLAQRKSQTERCGKCAETTEETPIVQRKENGTWTLQNSRQGGGGWISR